MGVLQLHSHILTQNSRLVPPADNHSTPGIVNPAVHGDGPIEVSLPGVATEIDSRVMDTSKSSGSEFPFNVDMNSGNPLGVGETSACTIPMHTSTHLYDFDRRDSIYYW